MSTVTTLKRFSDETIDQIKNLDLKEFAEAMGDVLYKSGNSYMAYNNHGERTPSVAITPSKGIWKDFSREGVAGKTALSYYCYRTWDTIDITSTQYVEAVRAVCAIAGIPIKYEDGTVEGPIGERNVSVSMVRETDISKDAKASSKELDEWYRALLDELPLRDQHTEHLLDVRGFSAEEIKVRQYRSMVDFRERVRITRKLIHDFGKEPEGIPGFCKFSGKNNNPPYWSLIGNSGFLIPIRSPHNLVCGFQIRVDIPFILEVFGEIKGRMNYKGNIEVSNRLGDLLWSGSYRDLLGTSKMQFPDGSIRLKAGPKYMWLSLGSNEERGILKGALIGHPTPAPYHVAVPSRVLSIWDRGESILDFSEFMDTKTVWWGEGPLKGDIASEFTNQIHLQLAGISSYEQLVEPTLALEPERVIIAFDADAQTKEKDVGETVIKAIERAREVFPPRGIRLQFALWSVETAKGLDDLLLKGYRPKLVDL